VHAPHLSPLSRVSPVTAVPVANFLRILASSLSTRACSCSALAQARMSEMKTLREVGDRGSEGARRGRDGFTGEDRRGLQGRSPARLARAPSTPTWACRVTFSPHARRCPGRLARRGGVCATVEACLRHCFFFSPPPPIRSRRGAGLPRALPNHPASSPAGRAWSAASPWWVEARERARPGGVQRWSTEREGGARRRERRRMNFLGSIKPHYTPTVNSNKREIPNPAYRIISPGGAHTGACGHPERDYPFSALPAFHFFLCSQTKRDT